MARLLDQHKRWIIQSLATFTGPAEVKEDLKTNFKLDVELDQIMYYDPTTANGEKLAQKWKDLFYAIRESFVVEVEHIAIAHRTWRLKQLETIARTSKAPMVKMKALEQAAKETGGMYVSHAGKEGAAREEVEAFDVVPPAGIGGERQAEGSGQGSGQGSDREGSP